MLLKKQSAWSLRKILGVGVVVVLGLVMGLKAMGFKGDGKLMSVESYEELVKVDHQMAVVSIRTLEENLWDEEKGIYVEGEGENMFQKGEEWEREAEMRFYEEGELEFEKKIGLRLHGWNMRGLPQKSFRIYFENGEGLDDWLEYPVFGEKGNERYLSLVLRIGGDVEYSMLRDRLASELVAINSKVDVQQNRPVVLYLNGEYWGIYYLQERFDEAYFKGRYRINPKMLVIVDVPLRSGEDKGQVVAWTRNSEKEAERYNQLLQRVRRCQACEDYYSVRNQIEVDNLLDYLLFELYFANIDWPYGNTKAWRYKVEPITDLDIGLVERLDGRWRWLLFDLDTGFGGATDTTEKMMEAAGVDSYSQLIDDAFPFRNLFYSRTFRKFYLERTKELVNDGLSAEAVVIMVDRLAAEIRSEMPRQIDRWGSEVSDKGIHVVESMEEWERRVELLKVFVRQRPEGFLQKTVDFMNKSY